MRESKAPQRGEVHVQEVGSTHVRGQKSLQHERDGEYPCLREDESTSMERTINPSN